MDTNPTVHSLRGAILQAAQALAHCRWQADEADMALQAASAAGGGGGGGSVSASASARQRHPPELTLDSLAATAPDDAAVLLSEASAATLTAKTTFEAFLAAWLAHAVAHPPLRDGRAAVEAFAALPDVANACAVHSPFGGHVLQRLRELQSPEEARARELEQRLGGGLW